MHRRILTLSFRVGVSFPVCRCTVALSAGPVRLAFSHSMSAEAVSALPVAARGATSLAICLGVVVWKQEFQEQG